MIVPRALRPGDTIAVIAPSSPFDAVLVWRGLGYLSTRYRVRFDRQIFARHGYLAGSDVRRERELREALEDPSVSAILAARGGYGASRFVHELDWTLLRDHPKWIVGFSDITAIHVEAARVGVASLHGSHVASLGRSDAVTRNALIDLLEDPSVPRTFSGLRVVTCGDATGPLFGGNLSLLHACAAAGRLTIPDEAILFIEDVTERPYRIDRMLATLAVGGHFRRLSGVVLGEFTSCHPGPDGVTVRAVLEERFGGLGIPVVDDLPSGHGLRNEPLVLGGPARIVATSAGGELRTG